MPFPKDSEEWRSFADIFASIEKPEDLIGKSINVKLHKGPMKHYRSEEQLQATVALEARKMSDPRWAALLYRLRSWTAQHYGEAMTEAEIVARLELLAAE